MRTELKCPHCGIKVKPDIPAGTMPNMLSEDEMNSFALCWKCIKPYFFRHEPAQARIPKTSEMQKLREDPEVAEMMLVMRKVYEAQARVRAARSN